MLDNFKIDGVEINRPFEAEGLKITAELKDGTLSEVQPVLNVNRFTFTNEGVREILKAREKYGTYRQIPLEFEFNNRQIFKGYLTDFNFLLDRDEIEAKPVSIESIDGLSELLSSIESSLLADDYDYQDLDFVIEPVDLSAELLQLGLSSLFYFYVLYTQIKEVQRIVGEAADAFTPVGIPPAPNIGGIIAWGINLAAQVVFLGTTIVQLVNYAIDAKELLIPTVRTTKVTSFNNLIATALARIGYKFITDIDELSKNYHWASGNVFKNEFFPRSKDRCNSALGTISLMLEKCNAKIRVIENTVYLLSPNNELFSQQSNYVLPDFVRGRYTENLDDMVGTREIIYEIDDQDKWTRENFTGTEYKIRANIDDPTKSTIKGLDQTNYNIALCNRKDELNALEIAWESFASLINTVVQLFGGGSQTLTIGNRIGVAKISSPDLSVAKIVRLENGRIPSNHRELLSAKADEENFHWTKSHVRNPKAKKRIYQENIAFDDASLSSIINNGYITDNQGTQGKFRVVEWEYDRDCADTVFELVDIDRKTGLKEEFYEPTR